MSVSRQEVVSAYRMLLGREPESAEAVAMYMGAPDWRTLRDIFRECPEYLKANQAPRVAGAPEVGRLIDAPPIHVETDASPQQMDAMFQRIYAAWRAFGESEPHWSVLTNDAFRRDTFEHHRESFFGHGRFDVDQYLAIARRASDRPLTSALDFGCGVGRLTIPLAERVGRVVGVDISSGHLQEARTAAQLFGSTAEFQEIASVSDIDRLGVFDFIMSRIVLQHNPPPIMADIYRRLLRRLAPGGVAVVQIPTYIVGYQFSVAEYLSGCSPAMEMNALPQQAIFAIVGEENCIVAEVVEDAGLGILDGKSHVFCVTRPAERAALDVRHAA